MNTLLLSPQKWGSVYMGMGEELIDQEVRESMPDLTMLLEMVAYFADVEKDQGGPLTIDGHVCLGRTQEYIVHRCNEFLQGFALIPSMTTQTAFFVSKRQLKKLMYFQKFGSGRVSCHSFVIVHVIFAILCEAGCQDKCLSELKQFAVCLQKVASRYEAAMATDEAYAMLNYFIRSFKPVSEELNEGFANKTAKEFPAIPRFTVTDPLHEL